MVVCLVSFHRRTHVLANCRDCRLSMNVQSVAFVLALRILMDKIVRAFIREPGQVEGFLQNP